MIQLSDSLLFFYFFFSSRRRHTTCALVTGVQTCALPICLGGGRDHRRRVGGPEGRVQARQRAAFLRRRVIFGLRDAADPDDQALDALVLASETAEILASHHRQIGRASRRERESLYG